MSVDISPVIDLALEYNPQMATKDISTIYLWINEGCEIESDILPAMKDIMKRKVGINSFSYFSNCVRAARDKRRIETKRSAKPKKTQSELDILKARSIAFNIRNLGRCMPSEERWLESYEKEHGPIAV